MPITDAVVLAVISIGFLGFAAVLAWGDYQTRGLSR